MELEIINDFTVGLIIVVAIALLAMSMILHFYESVETYVRDEIIRNVRRSLASPQIQPLFDIFYKFNHRNTFQWAKWVKTLDPETQDEVFASLEDYIERPVYEIDFIAHEIVAAVIHVEADGSFKTLEKFLNEARSKWGQYYILGYAYSSAIDGILNLDREAAIELIKRHISDRSATDDEEYKEYLVDALSIIEDDREFAQVMKELIIEAEITSKTKLYILKAYRSRGLEGDHDFYLDTLDSITVPFINSREPLPPGLFEEEDESEEFEKPKIDNECIDFVLTRLLELGVSQKEIETAVWEKMFSFFKNGNDLLQTTMLPLLQTKISNKSIEINNEYLFKIYATLSTEKQIEFLRTLVQEFNINEEEQRLFDEVSELKNLAEKYNVKDLKGMISTVEVDNYFDLPFYLKKSFEELKDIYENHKSGPQIQSLLGDGNASIDKFLLLKAVSQELNTKVMAIDVDSIMFAAEKIDEVTEKLLDDKEEKCIIYYYNSKQFFEAYAGPDSEKKDCALNVLSMMKTLSLTGNFKILLSIEYCCKELKEQKLEIHELLETGEPFLQVMDLGNISEGNRKVIFDELEPKINAGRDHDLTGFSEIAKYTNHMAAFSYTSFLLNYIKLSLLSHGKLVPVHLYEEYLAAVDSKSEESVAVEGEAVFDIENTRLEV